MSDFIKTIDVRLYDVKDKYTTISENFTGLTTGETIEIINDNDLRVVHYQFLIELADKFEWQYIEEGPEVWRVAITKK
ncbi:DUF2249 domain-containing protein [Clostridium sp. SHJSY1]|uniref:DUF2249 domain-containing protein n=1 Tax=Clostridium sp. SHJSY1 TaxID=2942483 RepID=UPI002875556E|nr:DUF2249 domain-containing protein [Clostridium sp. SHJSY1]MDS0524372.1 DUF2249 domain-containing protein [Clostridium sp. SHJSY1]